MSRSIPLDQGDRLSTRSNPDSSKLCEKISKTIHNIGNRIQGRNCLVLCVITADLDLQEPHSSTPFSSPSLLIAITLRIMGCFSAAHLPVQAIDQTVRTQGHI